MGCVQSDNTAASSQSGAGGGSGGLDASKDAVRLERRNNQRISSFINEDKKKETDVRKLLLLGAGESGKSTLFRQTRQLFGQRFSDNDLLDYVNTIAENTLENVVILIKNTPSELLAECQPDAKQAIEEVLKIDVHELPSLTPEIGRWIKKIWYLDCIQRTYDRRSEFQLQDSVKYYCENIDRISSPRFLPTVQDILMSRRTTLGVTEMEIEYKGKTIRMVDVGGQRSQRSKWLHQFSKCNGVIFVSAINEYDQVLREDEQTNRLLESIFLFHTICDDKNLRDLSLILFLNKSDLFEEKLIHKKIPLTDCFADYIEPNTSDLKEEDARKLRIEDGCKFIAKKFEEGNKNPHRDIYAHVTCATDTDNIRKVMTDLTDILIQDGLKYLGIIHA